MKPGAVLYSMAGNLVIGLLLRLRSLGAADALHFDLGVDGRRRRNLATRRGIPWRTPRLLRPRPGAAGGEQNWELDLPREARIPFSLAFRAQRRTSLVNATSQTRFRSLSEPNRDAESSSGLDCAVLLAPACTPACASTPANCPHPHQP